MKVSDFDFELPEGLIALRPVEPRDSAQLLVVRPGDGAPFTDRIVRDLPDLLEPGDALVFNDTRVIPARLQGFRPRVGGAGAAIEATLHLRAAPDRWWAFVRPAKRVAVGDTIRFGDDLSATVTERGEGGEALLAFDRSGIDLDVAIATIGHIPLPPYIAGKRPEDERDRRDYQTIYAKRDGAVAAPTAGLHFTEDLLARLDRRGVERHFLTLHVGAGTFLPVKVENVADHKMHAEWGEITPDTAARLNAVRARGRRIIAVGTTSLRLLESAWKDGAIQPFAGETSIFIAPGYRINAADVLMTNFHLPKSTLMMLVSAFSGQDVMRRAYAHAIASGYRFYSYGDSSLLFRAD
ncbi:MAG: tRNA preQ1(34) S-adenosylmethionine ribosyltransferase-isomerase QueA [Labrys sp. (in: a-proteobacteria)]